MNKIALISASILAVGAASIAAGADGLSSFPEATGFPLGSHFLAASATEIESGGQGVRNGMIERKVRLVSSTVPPVKSCDTANWPYYPADCLTESDPAGL